MVKKNKYELPFLINLLGENFLALTTLDGRITLDYDKTMDILTYLNRQFSKINRESYNSMVETIDTTYAINELFLYHGQDFSYFPIYLLRIRKKNYKKENSWNFKCSNCSKTILLNKGNSYYTMATHIGDDLLHSGFNEKRERACSAACMKAIAFEVAINSIGVKYQKYFQPLLIEQEISSYIKSL